MQYFLQWICIGHHRLPATGLGVFLDLMLTQTCMPVAGSLEAFSHLVLFFFLTTIPEQKSTIFKKKNKQVNLS